MPSILPREAELPAEESGFLQGSTNGPSLRQQRLAGILGVALASAFSGVEPKIGIATLRPLDVAAIGLICLALLRILYTGKVKTARLPVAFWLLAGYLVYRALIAAVLSPGSVFVKEGIQAVELIFIAALLSVITTHPVLRKHFLTAFTAGVGFIMTYAAVFSIAGGSYFSFKRFDEASIAPGLFATLCLARMGNAYRAPWARMADRIGLVIGVVLTVLSGARSSWFGFAVAVIVLSRDRSGAAGPGQIAHLRARRRLVHVGLFLLLSPAVLTAALVLISSAPQDSYLTRQVSSVGAFASPGPEGPGDGRRKVGDRDREVNLQLGWKAIRANPWMGVGPDNFVEYIEDDAARERVIAYQPHNEFMGASAETGVLGGVLYMASFLFVAKYYALPRLTRRFRSLHGYEQGAGLLAYGLVVNALLGGGAVNTILLIVPLGITAGIVREYDIARRRPAVISNSRASVPG